MPAEPFASRKKENLSDDDPQYRSRQYVAREVHIEIKPGEGDQNRRRLTCIATVMLSPIDSSPQIIS